MASKFVLPTIVKEVRFFLSQTGEASAPLRQFLNKSYPALRKSNPDTLILVREAYGVPPSLTTRLEKGKEIKTSLEGLSPADIEKALKSVA